MRFGHRLSATLLLGMILSVACCAGRSDAKDRITFPIGPTMGGHSGFGGPTLGRGPRLHRPAFGRGKLHFHRPPVVAAPYWYSPISPIYPGPDLYIYPGVYEPPAAFGPVFDQRRREGFGEPRGEPYAAPEEPATEAPPLPAAASVVPGGRRHYTNALAAFRGGTYRQALDAAQLAVEQAPRDPKSHQLVSAALFALGDYRGSAAAARTAVARGPASLWPSLFGYYPNAQTHLKHMQSLRSFVRQNPSEPDARFLLGYHYMTRGDLKSAQRNLSEAARLVPEDEQARRLLRLMGGTTPGGARRTPLPVEEGPRDTPLDRIRPPI